MNLPELQQKIAEHDGRNWLHETRQQTDEHNLLHTMKTLGRYAGYLEAIQDGKIPGSTSVDPTIIADLLIETLRFANNHGIDIGEAAQKRLAHLRERALASSISIIDP